MDKATYYSATNNIIVKTIILHRYKKPDKIDLQFIISASPKQLAGSRSIFIINFDPVQV